MATKTDLTATELQEAAQRIKMLRRAATEHAVEIGRELLRVKESLPHGAFAKWVEKACEFKIRTAQDLMKLAREAGANTNVAALMVPSTLRVYLSKTTPPAVRTSILKRLEKGDYISRSELHCEILDAQPKSPSGTGGRRARDDGSGGPALLTAEGSPADLEGDRPRMVAELLIRRLSRQDFELIMQGMNWEVWNRIFVWMRAARVVDSDRVELVQPGARAISSTMGTTTKLQ